MSGVDLRVVDCIVVRTHPMSPHCLLAHHLSTHKHTTEWVTNRVWVYPWCGLQYDACLISAPQYPRPRVNHVSMYEEEGRVTDFYFVFHDTATTPFRLKTTAKC